MDKKILIPILIIVAIALIAVVILIIPQAEEKPALEVTPQHQLEPEPFISPLTGEEVGSEDVKMDYGLTTRDGKEAVYITIEGDALYGNCGKMTAYFDPEAEGTSFDEVVDCCYTEVESAYCQDVAKGALSKIWETIQEIGTPPNA